MNPLLAAVVSLYVIGSALGDTKTWTKSTNFDDPANWNGGGIVCSNDRKVFPKELVVSVYIQKNDSLQELVLSNNMVMTFAEGAVLSFNTKVESQNVATVAPSPSVSRGSDSRIEKSTPPAPKATCLAKGRVLKFEAKASSWFDPQSWSSQQTAVKDHKRFLLDLEKVPCSQDRVVFLSKNSFLVDLASSRVQAATMLIHNEEIITQSTFNTYWAGDVSRYEFVQRAKKAPVIGGTPCDDGSTCQCKDRYTDYMKTSVCKNIKCADNKNLTAVCSHPILPAYGQCCSLCGSRLKLRMDTALSPDQFHRLHQQLVEELRHRSDVRYTLGPLVNKSMEVILVDTAGSGKAADSIVCSLRDRLLKNETAQYLGLTAVTFDRSDGMDHCRQPQATTLASTRKSSSKWDYIIIGVSLAFIVVCVLVVSLGVFLYRKKYSVNGKNEMELGNVGPRSSQGFDNPVYDTPLPFEDNFNITYDSSMDQVNGFENAMYSADVDSGASSSSTEKKTPLEDPYAPVVKKPKKKSSSGKKRKAGKDVGFDNPVYALKGGQEEGTGSMVSVPLDEDDSELPAYVEHDGTGFANPIVTGLSEEMMAPPLPKKEPIDTDTSKGFDNPLFSEGKAGAGAEVEADLGEVTVHVQPSKKKKKAKSGGAKAHMSKNGDAPVKELGFGNPLYGQDDEPQNFYQPETPGEDDSTLKVLDRDEEGL